MDTFRSNRATAAAIGSVLSISLMSSAGVQAAGTAGGVDPGTLAQGLEQHFRIEHAAEMQLVDRVDTGSLAEGLEQHFRIEHAAELGG